MNIRLLNGALGNLVQEDPLPSAKQLFEASFVEPNITPQAYTPQPKEGTPEL